MVVMFVLGLFIASAEAGNKVSVAVSCTIPPLLQMNIEEEKIEVENTQEEPTIKGKLCVQQESVEVAEAPLMLYSFYER